MILIYAKLTTNRLIYVLDFCFKSKQCDFKVTDSFTEFNNFEGIKINYSSENLGTNLTIQPDGLLFNTDINQSIHIDFNNNQWLINGIKDDFSVIFYFLTCYEEYTVKERDEHDRFSAQHSTFTKFNRLQRPNIDIIVKDIWQKLNLDYTPIKAQYKSILTFDIDSAWAVKHKSLGRQIGSDLKSIIKRESLQQKKDIRQHKLKDPFDTFDQIKKLAIQNDVICFFLLGDWGKFDKNINWKTPEFQKLILDLSHHLSIGIHPSYKSYLKQKTVQKEIDRLNEIIGKQTIKSRQHFLKLKLPDTYTILIENGIKEDYSMGFADGYGFRAGTCFPFYFFDLTQNSVTDLKVYPITYMDGTLNQYLNLSIEQSCDIVTQLKQTVKDVGGYFIPLWHNETIGNSGIWKGWKEVFDCNLG